MKMKVLSKIATLSVIIILMSCSANQNDVSFFSKQNPLVVFLVRHGEKVDNSKNPNLSVAGLERATNLAKTLRNAEIEYVHSSDYIRTRDTALPTATTFGLQVELYNPQDLSTLVEKLKRTGGRHLVVGHSNSTPSMVELLGGKPGTKINEENEYDRLYIITLAKNGSVQSLLMRYGTIYQPRLN
jgi:phosphohistidine phosphatase SixA